MKNESTWPVFIVTLLFSGFFFFEQNRKIEALRNELSHLQVYVSHETSRPQPMTPHTHAQNPVYYARWFNIFIWGSYGYWIFDMDCSWRTWLIHKSLRHKGLRWRGRPRRPKSLPHNDLRQQPSANIVPQNFPKITDVNRLTTPIIVV